MTHWHPPYHHTSGISIHKIGTNVTHDSDFILDRPHGYGDDFIFIHFSTSIDISDERGRKIEPPGACIICSPGTSQYYSAAGASFTHSWFHVVGEKAGEGIALAGIPQNKVFHLPTADFIEDAIRAMYYEVSNCPDHWQCNVAAKFFSLCIELGRMYKRTGTRPDNDASAEQRVMNVRTIMQENCTKLWTIDSLARQASLSVSRFSAIYKKLFNISPIDDVISARLHKSCSMLFGSTTSVKIIAQKCGFSDPAYFSRIFTKRIGIPPTEYAKREEWYFPKS